MAGQRRYQTKHVQRFVVFLVLVCLAAGLVRRVAQSSSSSLSHSDWLAHRNPGLVQPYLNLDLPTPRLNRIYGRWEAVRASLGLPPLPREVVFAPGLDPALPVGQPDKRASRFDLGRKRRTDEATRQLLLRFAPDTRPTHPDETIWHATIETDITDQQ